MKLAMKNNKLVTFNNKLVKGIYQHDLSDNTIRVRFKQGYTPTMGSSRTLVDSANNIWDIYQNYEPVHGYNSWFQLFYRNDNLLEVIGANSSNITNMRRMFMYCSSLTSVALFDTSNVTTMYEMFSQCGSLTSIQLFDTYSVTNMSRAFQNCYNVEGGALALYQRASTQAIPPSNHSIAFSRCGENTITGAAELAQIPSDWK